MKFQFERIVTSPFLMNIGKMMSGTGFAHLLGIAVMPVLTRLYTPDQIGVYATFISIYFICFSVISLRFEHATLLPKNNYAANNITVLAGAVALLLSTLLMTILMFFSHPVSRMLNVESLGRLIYLIPVSVLMFSFFIILTYSLNRSKRYGQIAAGKIISSTGTATGQLGLGLLQFQSFGLVLGKVVGDILGMVFLVWRRYKLEQSILAGVSYKRMAAMAKRYRNFPLYNAPHSATNAISANVPVLLLNSLFSSTMAGYYAMARRALFSPVQVISQAAYQVFSQRLSEKYSYKDRIIPFIHSNLMLMMGVGIFPFLILFLISPLFFSWFLGPDWEMTGHFVRLLTPFIYLVFIVTPLNFIPLMLGRQRKALMIDVIYLLLRVAAILIGVYMNSVWIAIGLYSAVGVVVNVYILLWVYSIAKVAEKTYVDQHA